MNLQVSVFLFINASGKHPDRSSYILSHEFKDWRCNKNIFTLDSEELFFWLSIIFWTAVPIKQSELKFPSLVGLALGSGREMEHYMVTSAQWQKTLGPVPGLKTCRVHLLLHLLFPKGAIITLNQFRNGALCQLWPKKGPSKPLVKISFILSSNPILLPLKLPFTSLLIACNFTQ